jgi:hypothetical protein
MRVVAFFAVVAMTGIGSAAEPRSSAAATGLQGNRPVKFDGGLGTVYEGLTVALLGSCSFEGDGAKEQWENALKGDHLRIKFPKSRSFEINLENKATALPKQILVRNGTIYRSFAKHDPKICFFIQDQLKALSSGR